MSAPGRPKALDDAKQASVCSLIAAGVSLRQVAFFVGCAPQSIRREAERNDRFRKKVSGTVFRVSSLALFVGGSRGRLGDFKNGS